MPVTRKDACEFYYFMAKHTAATPGQCQRLLRLAASLHRFDVERCNRQFTERDERKIGRLQDKVWTICAEIETEHRKSEPQHGDVARRRAIYAAVFTDEPMAPAVVIQVPDGFSNYMGEVKGIGVPA